MRKLTILMVLLVAASAYAQLYSMTDNAALNTMRACTWNGTNTQVSSVTGSSTASAQLTAGRVYRVYCATDTYFNQGGSTVTAASTRGTVKGGVELWVYTRSGADYIAFRSATSNGTCDITECR